VLDRFCAEIGRDPASITRSLVLPVSYDEPGRTRDVIARGVGAGFRHFVLSLPAPYPENVARWVADEVISRSRLSRQGAPAGRFADGADAATGPGPVGRSVHACSEVIRAVADTHPTGQPKSGPERTRGSAHSRRAAAAAVKRRISGRNRTASRQAIDWKRPRHRRGAATQSRGAVPDAE
jgi:hypothetical protein